MGGNDTMQASKERSQEQMKHKIEKKDITPMVHIIMKAIALAMGVAVVVLSNLKELDVNSGLGMLGIGLACLAISSLSQKNEE